MEKVYKYRIHLNERGSFFATVDDENDREIFRIDDDSLDFFDHGWMKHPNDLGGLHEYLIHVGHLNDCDYLDCDYLD